MSVLFTLHVPEFAINEGGYLGEEEEEESQRLYHFRHSHHFSSTATEDSDENEAKEEEEEKRINLLEVLRDALVTKWQVSKVHFHKCADTTTFQVTFTTPKKRTEFVLSKLLEMGIGDSVGSVWIGNLDVVRPKIQAIDSTPIIDDKDFVESIKSRLIVEKVVEAAARQAELSFDYVALVCVASVLAFLGLAYNNVVVIVASMLVSPIMGPVVAVTFGITIRDWKLLHTGIVSELISLIICIVTGVLMGLCFISFDSELDWPTEEMLGRGTLKGLLSGILVAIPSGIGVALSILGNNTSSLVGVAISASLLPPAVNTGILLVIGAFQPDSDKNLFMKALISLLLTLANIVAILLMAFLMFKIKEVAPIQGKALFWKEDVQMSRAYNGVVKGEEAEEMARKLQELTAESQMGRVPNNSVIMSNYLSLNTVNSKEIQRERSSTHIREIFRQDLVHLHNEGTLDTFRKVNKPYLQQKMHANAV